MDLLIPNSWLKKHLDTKATPIELAKYLSLCGPSIERTKKTTDGDYIYNVEVTTNRVDTASIIGIAREAATILPRFGIKAKLTNTDPKNTLNHKFTKKVKYLEAVVDPMLCSRFTAVLIKNVVTKDSPQAIKSLLEKVGVRPINNIVDVSNYIMHELGQPVHTFDYDKITKNKMVVRESKKGEILKTLDGKEFKLEGGDIVIEDGSGKLIDLCGIMGGENSAIDLNTKNVLLFVQNYNQHKIRKTSMLLGQRTEAAVLFEKGLDSEGIKDATLSAIELIEKLSGGKAEKEIFDIYPTPYKTKVVTTTKETLDRIIGIEIENKDITSYLESLGFEVEWLKNTLKVKVPSWRSNDIEIPEDIAEEIARIYGYHNLPCILMDGPLPKKELGIIGSFKFEDHLKQILKSLGSIEVYNLSLVSKEMAGSGALQLKNPLGSDTEYLRTTLKESLIKNVLDNVQEKEDFHMFEIANIYIARKDDLPKERLTLAGIIKSKDASESTGFRKNKGIVASILNELNIDYVEYVEDGNGYLPNQKVAVKSNKLEIGEYGNLENGLFFYNFDLENLMNAKKILRKYKEVAKYPPQVEDLTLQIPEKTFIGHVIDDIKNNSKLIANVDLKDIYENSHTFNIQYQAEDRTLTDKEVEEIRIKLLDNLKTKFGISIKQ